MASIVVVDYGLGNLKNVQRAFKKIGGDVCITSDPVTILGADRIVLPGVGSFSSGMDGLRKSGLVSIIDEFIKSGKDLLGICLGMQMLLSNSEENGRYEGLGYISGSVKAIPQKENNKYVRKTPHIGWSELISPDDKNEWNNSILKETTDKDYFYFVHSYMAIPDNRTDILASCEYDGIIIPAVIKHNNITGIQFHPEKSGSSGLKILRNFLDY